MKKSHERYSNVKIAKGSFLLIFILAIALTISACGKSDAIDSTSDVEPQAEESQEEEQVQEPVQEESPTEEQLEEILSIDEIVTSFEPEASVDIPDYAGELYVVMNDNIPFFTKDNLPTTSFEYYSELDELGRCGVACAYVITCFFHVISYHILKRKHSLYIQISGSRNQILFICIFSRQLITN